MTLSANASDTDGTIAKVEFYNGTTLLGSTTAAPYSFNWAKVPAGSYSITAKAIDSYGIANTSTAVPVISNAPPQISFTSPANNAVSTAPGSFTLTANANDTDGTIAKVEFFNGTTLLGSATAGTGGSYSSNWANIPAGVYTLTAVATDNRGATATTAPITLVSDAAPSINLTSPTANSTVMAPASLNLAASATSQLGTISKVEFYNGTTLLGSSTTAPYSYTWASVPAGNYSISAKATDSYGLSASSAAVTVTVKSAELVAYYVYPDQLGTPREITDQAGSVVWQWDNADPYGNNVPNENPSGAGQFSFPLRFPGQYADRETNTYYNVNRDYDAATGRYVQSDPIGLMGGINTYAYANGNPTGYSDPYGQLSGWDSAVGAIIGYVGGAAGSAIYQYISTGKVNWASANEAGVWGAAAGAIAPVVATTATGAAAVGAISNAAQYVTSTDNFSTSDFIQTVIAGAVGGVIAGPFVKSGNIFIPTTAAQSINANLTAEGVGSAIAGGGIASVNTVPNNGVGAGITGSAAGTAGGATGAAGGGKNVCRN